MGNCVASYPFNSMHRLLTRHTISVAIVKAMTTAELPSVEGYYTKSQVYRFNYVAIASYIN